MSDEAPDLARARVRADQARQQLMSSVDDLLAYAQDMQKKLAPSHLARDAWEAAKDKGADLAEDAVDAVRKRPIAAGGAVAAIALFIVREPLMELAERLWNGNGGKSVKTPRRARASEDQRMEKVR